MNKIQIKHFAKVLVLCTYALAGVAVTYVEIKGYLSEIVGVLLLIAYVSAGTILFKTLGVKAPSGALVSRSGALNGIVDFLKLGIYLSILIGLGLVGPRYLPNTNFGAILLFTPAFILISFVMYYFLRLIGLIRRP
jgi:hypothetical protein